MSNKMGGAKARRKRWVLLWAQACICPACGGIMNPDAPQNAPDYPTIDHIETQGRGGAHALSNLLIKHRYCNEARGDKLATARDRAAQELVQDRLSSRPLTAEDCEAAARKIYAVHRASRMYQPNAHRQPRAVAA